MLCSNNEYRQASYQRKDTKFTKNFWIIKYVIFSDLSTVSLEIITFLYMVLRCKHNLNAWQWEYKLLNDMLLKLFYNEKKLLSLILGRMKEETVKHFLSVVKLLNSYLATWILMPLFLKILSTSSSVGITEINQWLTSLEIKPFILMPGAQTFPKSTYKI